MRNLFIHLLAASLLFLWAWDMTFPWQKTMRLEQNHYEEIQKSKTLRVGMINHPLSYFFGANGAEGIEYDLISAFANYLKVKVDIKSYDTSESLFNALLQNDIDLAAAGLPYQPIKAKILQVGASYYTSAWQVVYKKGSQRPYKIDELKSELIIPAGSAILPILQQLKISFPNLKWIVTNQFTQEELLLQVAEGKIPYTVALSVDVSSAQHIKPNIAIGFNLTEEYPIVWYLQNSVYSELQASVLEFMNQAHSTGLISRIEEKYFNHLAKFDYVDTQSYLRAIENVLPKYQPLFEKYRGDLDWQMLAAIAYQESHWNPNATSPTGVRGMMMLTRATAERMNVKDRTNVEQSIKAGSEYLHLLINQLPKTIANEDRIWFGLAAYNMGLGHLLDVRRLTTQLGEDPNDWLAVKKNLPLLAQKRYYEKLKYGYARGFEAFNYVENIRRYYHSMINYQRIKEQEQIANARNVPNDITSTQQQENETLPVIDVKDEIASDSLKNLDASNTPNSSANHIIEKSMEKIINTINKNKEQEDTEKNQDNILAPSNIDHQRINQDEKKN